MIMSGESVDVAIVGAGLAGLVCLYKLNESRVDAMAFESQASGLGRRGAGILLHPNAFDRLESLRHLLVVQGCEIKFQQVFSAAGQLRSVVDWEEVWGPGRLPLALQRDVLASTLRELAGERSIANDHELSDVKRAGAKLELIFESGMQAEARVLIGADGVHSKVRSTLFEEAVRRSRDMYWRAVVPTNEPSDASWTLWQGARLTVGQFPVGSGLKHVFVQMLGDQVDARSAVDAIAESIGSFCSAAQAVCESVMRSVDVHAGPSWEVESTNWCVPGVALMGDAAHAMSPVLSQGGGLALQDGLALAEAISHFGVDAQALQAYEETRRPIATALRRNANLHRQLQKLAPSPVDGEVGSHAAWYGRMYKELLHSSRGMKL